MIELFRKIFIKDYKNVSDEGVRSEHGKLAAWFGIFTNFILVAIKISVAVYLWSLVNFGAGLLSIALVSDAINNLSDLANCVVTLVSFKISAKPADKEHPFGHERIEYIAGLIVSIAVVLVAVELFRDSITAVSSGDTVKYNLVTVIMLGAAVLIKLLQGYFNYGMGKAIDSVTLKATSVDSLTDALATTLVTISAILYLTMGWDNLDGYMGMAVSIFIFYSGIKMIKDTADPLIGEGNNKEIAYQVVKKVLSHKGIIGVHDVICHSYGPTKYYMSLHAEVDQRMNILDAHEIIDDAEEDVKKTFRIDITIHMDPVAVGDPVVDELKKEVRETLGNYDSSLLFHDFRIVKGQDHTNIIFDIVVPYGDKHTDEEITQTLSAHFSGRSMIFKFVINFDRPFD
jgi:cation diffusion facilitator family transporter